MCMTASLYALLDEPPANKFPPQPNLDVLKVPQWPTYQTVYTGLGPSVAVFITFHFMRTPPPPFAQRNPSL